MASTNNNSVIEVNIKPDIQTIETFNHISTVPNESFTITGTIQVTLTRPMQIRQIYVKFQGDITSILSSIDFLRDKSDVPSYGDEIPLDKWETNDENITLMDKVARKAFGYSNITRTIAKKHVYILDELQELPAGTTYWPFSISINDIHQLPPSIVLPFHQIKYCLSAHIKSKNGLSDRLKVSYWNTRVKTNGNTQDIDTTSPPLADPFEDLAPFSTTKVKQYLLGVDHTILLKQYTYPSLYSLHSIPQIRFRGSRKDFLSYEVHMPKFACLQKTSFLFNCTFRSMSPEATIDKIESHLVQIEKYPIRAGNYTKVSPSAIQEVMVPRNRKFCRTTHDLTNYVDGSKIDLNLKFDLPHISPSIDSETLRVSHKLRLIITFKNDTKCRDMTLSFPLTVGSVPIHRQTMTANPPELFQVDNNSIFIRQNVDQWLFISEEYDLISSDDFNKLPSYRDVLREGNPPSPFLEDIL